MLCLLLPYGGARMASENKAVGTIRRFIGGVQFVGGSLVFLAVGVLALAMLGLGAFAVITGNRMGFALMLVAAFVGSVIYFFVQVGRALQ